MQVSHDNLERDFQIIFDTMGEIDRSSQYGVLEMSVVSDLRVFRENATYQKYFQILLDNVDRISEAFNHESQFELNRDLLSQVLFFRLNVFEQVKLINILIDYTWEQSEIFDTRLERTELMLVSIELCVFSALLIS